MNPQDAQADFEGSTITPSERRAFAKLFEMGQNNDTATAESKASMASKSRLSKMQNLDDIMEAADEEFEYPEEEFPRPLQRMAREAQERRRSNSKPSQGDAIAAAAKKDLSTVAHHFACARSDVELWSILQKHVFKRVLRLNLDGTSGKKTRKALKQATSDLDTSSEPRGNNSNSRSPKHTFTDLEVLTLTLPKHLTTAHNILRHRFPASPLQLSLLPHLRTLGPAAFAMGISTHLYNVHMKSLYYVTLDLDGVVETLREMDEQVYDYDAMTEVLIGTIIKKAKGAREGRWGEAVRELWSSEAMRRKIMRLGITGKVVRQRRVEAALRTARAEEAGEDAEEG